MNLSLMADQTSSIPTMDESFVHSYNLGKLLVSIAYGSVFAFGEFGNIWVFVMTSKVLYSGTNRTCRYICRYILALSFSDIILLGYLPLFIIDQNQRSWTFGSSVCKIYFGLEGVNKLLSVYILTAIGLERFLATWHPLGSCQIRSNRRTYVILINSVVMAVVIMSPAFLHSDLYQQEFNFTRSTGRLANNNSTEISVSWKVEVIKRCAFLAPEAFQEKFVLFSFLVGFCIPTALMLFFYGGSFVALRYHQKRQSRRPSSKMRRTRWVTCKIVTVICCYLLCWTPYWGFAVVGIFYSEFLRNPTDKVIYSAFFIHLLPYISSSLNPLLYVAISEDLRKNMRFSTFSTRNSPGVTDVENNSNRTTIESGKNLRCSRVMQLEETISLNHGSKNARRATEANTILTSAEHFRRNCFRRRTRSDLI